MKNKKDEKPEPTPEEVELVVTQEDYEAGLKRGWTDDDMLKPGRYKIRRGGFLKRHPELRLEEKKRALGLTLENAEWLRERAVESALTDDVRPGAASVFGDKYVIDSVLEYMEKSAIVRFSWIVEFGTDVPRLTSCYVK